MTTRRSSRPRDALTIGNHRATLAAVRALAGAGHRVVLGSDGNTFGNDRSRHVADVWRHPPLAGPAFGEHLAAELAERPEIGWVLPVTEEAVRWFAAHDGLALPGDVVVATPPAPTVRLCGDKMGLLHEARRAGVPTASSALVDTAGELEAVIGDIGYPCIVRPVATPVRLFDRKALIFDDTAALRELLPRWPAEPMRLLVQQYIEWPRHNLYFVAHAGELLSAVQVRIERTDRSDGTGLAVEGVTVAPHPEVLRHSRALVGALGYTGVGCAQFLVGDGEGEVSFIEINPRLGANFAIVQRCGIDLPRCACLLAAGAAADDLPVSRPYPEGLRYAWLYGDLAGLRFSLRYESPSAGEVLAWARRMVAASLRADLHLTWSWRDPLPTLAVFAWQAGRLAVPRGEEPPAAGRLRS